MIILILITSDRPKAASQVLNWGTFALTLWCTFKLALTPWGHKFANKLDDAVIERLSTYSPRQASNLLLIALGKAAVNGNKTINPIDIATCDAEVSKIHMGYL